jgi:hypothetical protein
MEMVYIDDDGETRDTIRLLIPVDKKEKNVVKTEETTKVPEKENATDSSVRVKPLYELTKEEKEIIKEANRQAKISMVNSDCKNYATEDDFLKARKKMVAENTDEGMIKAAKKIFKTRCFSTLQVKNLSVLFLKDEGKYLFFEAAYPFISDSEQFQTLVHQLTDENYINRFSSLIKK